MMEDTNKDELIERYLLGQLQGRALIDFNKKLKTDAAFRREVALEQAINRNLKSVGREVWRSKLENFHNDLEENPDTKEATTQEAVIRPINSPKTRVSKYFLTIAASVVLVVVSTFLIYNAIQSANPEKLYTAYYQPYEGLASTTRSESANNLTNLEKAFRVYNSGDYRNSIDYFKSVTGNEEKETALFYLGNAYLASDSTASAIQTYTVYLKQFTEYEVEARWYLALSYLKEENTNAAKPLLEQMAKENNDYSQKAADILNKLRE